MRILTVSLIALALVGCKKPADTATVDNGIAANMAANDAVAADNMATANQMVTPAGASLNHTTWEFVQNSRAMQESIDDTGHYIATAGKDHMDHGTMVMKDGKPCFTSAMTKDGEICWTNPNLEIGKTGETVSDKGVKLTLKRVDYVPKTM